MGRKFSVRRKRGIKHTVSKRKKTFNDNTWTAAKGKNFLKSTGSKVYNSDDEAQLNEILKKDNTSDESESSEEEVAQSNVSNLLATFSDNGNEEDSSSSEDNEEGNEIVSSDNCDNSDQEEEQLEENEDYSFDKEVEESTESLESAFFCHFGCNLTSSVAEQIRDHEHWKTTFVNWHSLGRCKYEVPLIKKGEENLLLLQEDSCKLPNIAYVSNIVQESQDYYMKEIKQSYADRIVINHSNSADIKNPIFLNVLQRELLSLLSSYSDVYYPNVLYDMREEIRTVYCMHIINHTLKVQNLVLCNNTKLKNESHNEIDNNYRDQGFARPRVLVLLPFKHSAFKFIETMAHLMTCDVKKQSIQGMKRFMVDFGPKSKEVKSFLKKPDDFQETFKGDIKEDFTFGVKMTKNSFKLYTEFYKSDVIVASPLGLRCIIGSPDAAVKETDFLTSIEIVILDQADVFVMQNWEHLLIIMESLNLPPKNLAKLDVNLSRVREWSLNNYASLYRQTLLFAATPVDLNRGLIAKSLNFTGKVQVLNFVNLGSITEVVVPLELTLTKVPGFYSPDERFKYFISKVLSEKKEKSFAHTLLYIPDYCDYLRIFRYMKKDGGFSFATVNEYMVSETSKVSKARSIFYSGRKDILLYTERFHFYQRITIKGVRHIIFYDLPTYPHFFSELCNFMMDVNQSSKELQKYLDTPTVTVLYQTSDSTKLVCVLGSARAKDVINSDKNLHICVIGR